ncbi:MAG TPA: isochorismatase family protein [Polyangiaceae bacterium]|jgi:nicotinamidase-related amidase|nr:isochorismatase family protein [Polyangiaceae bacterium]
MPATALDPRTALVVIDLQNGLSRFPTLRPFPEVVANTVKLAQAFRRAELPVVLVSVGFSADGGDRLVTRTEAPPRVIPTTPEFAKIVPELGPEPGDIVITKRQPSAFYGTELELQLRRRRITGIVLAGVASSIGVDSTARAAFERAYNITFATDAITDVDPFAEEYALTRSFPRLGELDSTDAILALMPQ